MTWLVLGSQRVPPAGRVLGDVTVEAARRLGVVAAAISTPGHRPLNWLDSSKLSPVASSGRSPTVSRSTSDCAYRAWPWPRIRI
ncbi:MAG: hypothetical protein ACRDNF_13345, partial [Streptosporangiaceae bacterium]